MTDVQALLSDLQIRVAKLERIVGAESNTECPPEARETAVSPWKHLVRRSHPWRRQLYLKGRNLTVRQLVGSMITEGRNAEQTASDYDLCVEAVREAMVYFDQNRELINAEVAMEREQLAAK